MKTTTTTIIDAPPSMVFLWLEDKDRLLQWVPNLKEDEVIVETAEQVGSRFKQVFLENGKKIEMVGEIMAYAENERLRAVLTGDMFVLDVDHKLSEVSGGKTELVQDSIIRFKGVFKIMAPLMVLVSKFSSKDPQADAHAKLKAMAEADHRAS